MIDITLMIIITKYPSCSSLCSTSGGVIDEQLDDVLRTTCDHMQEQRTRGSVIRCSCCEFTLHVYIGDIEADHIEIT